jgi:hypothetical protein
LRQADIEDQHVRLEILAKLHGFEPVRGLCDDGYPGSFEQAAQAAPYDAVVVS